MSAPTLLLLALSDVAPDLPIQMNHFAVRGEERTPARQQVALSIQGEGVLSRNREDD
jgi:hypothetical protein